MKPIAELFTRTIRKLHRDTNLGICAVATAPPPADGSKIIGAYSVAGAGTEAMEFAAETFLQLVIQVTEEDASACPCCVARGERAREALAIIRQRPPHRTAH